VLAFLAAACPGPASAFTAAQRTAFRTTILREKLNDDYPGMAVGVWSAGHGAFVLTPGHARIGKQRRPVTRRTSFRVGSITKTFTATIILRLVQSGALRLDDTVSQFVGGIPNGRQITLRELLSHTSGLPDFSSRQAVAFLEHPQRQQRPLPLIRAAIASQGVVTPTPAPFLYSNVNYLLLGVIARRVAHESIRSQFSRLIDHVGLGHTEFRPRPRVPRHMAHGYFREAGQLTDTLHFNVSWLWTAGSVISRLGDLRRWVQHVATGHRLLDRRLQRQRLELGATSKYGLGILGIPARKGSGIVRFYGHDGIAPGYDSLVLYSPARRITIVALGNTETMLNEFPHRPRPPDPYLGELGGRLACIALHPSLNPRAGCGI
jgi:D-alanyl-D-alanine carboxypeptidase